MVSDVVLAPIAAPAPPAERMSWASRDGKLEPWTQELPQLTLLPRVATRVDPEHPNVVQSIWDVLASWRAAERDLLRIGPDSPDWPRIHAEFVGLRAAYHRLFNERLRPTRAASISPRRRTLQPMKDVIP